MLAYCLWTYVGKAAVCAINCCLTATIKIHDFYPLNTVIILTTLNKLSLTQPSIPL